MPKCPQNHQVLSAGVLRDECVGSPQHSERVQPATFTRSPLRRFAKFLRASRESATTCRRLGQVETWDPAPLGQVQERFCQPPFACPQPMAAGVSDRLWSVEDLVVRCEAYEQQRGERGGSVNSQMGNWKIFLGTLLLILTPAFLFVKPVTEGAILRDLALVIWWAFVLWLLVPGFNASRPTNSK